MSVRAGEENLIDMIRHLQDQVNRLTNQGTNYRTNGIRIGDVIISWDRATSQLTARNVSSGGPAVVIATVP